MAIKHLKFDKLQAVLEHITILCGVRKLPIHSKDHNKLSKHISIYLDKLYHIVLLYFSFERE